MRPGNFWSYLLICGIALAAAHDKALPIGQEVAAVYQQVIDGLQLSSHGGTSGPPAGLEGGHLVWAGDTGRR